MKKHSIIILALGAYTLILAVWGYCNNTASVKDVLLTLGGMALLLLVLWFLLRKKAEIQERYKNLPDSEKNNSGKSE